MKEETIYLDAKLRQKWLKTDLPQRWKRSFPHLFDDENLRLTDTQRIHHFAEWFAAIKYSKPDYKVLIEKYCCQETHRHKLDELRRMIKDEGICFLYRKGIQPPDLFVYNKETFFFVDVKLENDRLKPKQKEFFQQIQEHFNKDVIICHLKSKNAREHWQR